MSSDQAAGVDAGREVRLLVQGQDQHRHAAHDALEPGTPSASPVRSAKRAKVNAPPSDHHGTRAGGQALAQRCIGEQSLDRRLERHGVAEPHEQPGLPVLHDVERALRRGGDDRCAEVHGLEKHDAEALLAARQDEGGAAAVEGDQLVVVHAAQEVDAVCDAEAHGHALEERQIGCRGR